MSDALARLRATLGERSHASVPTNESACPGSRRSISQCRLKLFVYDLEPSNVNHLINVAARKHGSSPCAPHTNCLMSNCQYNHFGAKEDEDRGYYSTRQYTSEIPVLLKLLADCMLVSTYCVPFRMHWVAEQRV